MVIEADEFGEQQEMDEVEQENGSGNSEEEEEEEEVPQIRRQQGQIRMVTSIENAQMSEESVPPSAAGTDAAQPAQQQAAPQSPAPAAAAPKSPAPTQSAAPASPAPATAAPKSPAPTQSAAPASPAPTQTAAPASPAPAAVVPQSPGAAQQTSLEEAKRRQQEAMEKARAEALRMQEEARAKAEAARQQHQQQAAEQAKLQAEQQLKAQQEAAKRQAEERAQQLKAQQQQQQKQTVQVQQQQQQETSPSVTAPQQKKAPATAAAAAPAPQQPTKAPEQPKQQQAKPAAAADAQKAAPVQQQQQPKSAAVAQQPKAAAAAPKPTAPPPTAAQTRAPPPVVREVQLPEAPSKPILRHAEYTPKLVDSSVNKLPPGQEPEEEQVEPSSVPRNPAIEDNAWQVQRRVQPEYQPVQPGKLNATGEFLVESEAQKSIVPEAVGYSKVQWNEFPEEEEKEQQTVPKVKAQEWVPEHDVEHHVQKTVYQPGRIGPDPNTGRLWPPPGYGEEEQTEIGKGEKTKCIADNGWIMSNGAEPAEDDGEVGNAPWKAHTRGGDVKNRQWPPEENAAEKEMAKGGRIGAQWPPPEQEEMEQQRVEILQTHIPVKDKVREWKPRSLFPQFEETETTEEGA